MKVAYINTVFGIKSTGRTYLELKNTLEEQGHECKAFYGVGSSNEPNTYRIGNRFSYLVHNVLSRVLGLEGYFSSFATRKLIKQLKAFNPDIIHLGCLHGHYLNLPLLFKYLHKVQKPVFITTHDCWCFTGKCTHFKTLGCDRYKTGCHSCPSKKKYPQSLFFDYSKKMFKDKKNWFTGLEKLNVICVSGWMKEQVEGSYFDGKNVVVNYNWINTDVFKPISDEEREEIREKYAIAKDETLIIAVSSFWSANTPRHEDICKLIERLENKQKLLVVGQVNDELPQNERVMYIPFVSDVSYLAKLYAASDVYVHFSVEDTFGKVIAEAQACGTPAIVYDSTACPEVARIGNGYVVPPRDIGGVCDAISDIAQMPLIDIKKQREKCANSTKQTLSKAARVDTLINLYKDAIK